MCYSDLKGAREVVLAELMPEATPEKSAAPPWAPSDIAQLWLAGFTCLLVIVVGIGIAGQEEVLLIPYALMVLPALAAATIRVTRRRLKGESTSVIDSVATMMLTGLISLTITICLIIVLGALAIIYAIAACFGALKG
jgi:hypothetical protein